MPTGRRKSTSSTHSRRQHVDLHAALDGADIDRDAAHDLGGARAQRQLGGRAHLRSSSSVLRTVAGSSGTIFSIAQQILDQRRRHLVGAAAGVGIGAAAALHGDGEAEPQHAFLAEAHGGKAARLAVEHAVARYLPRAVLEQPGGAPLAAGLLVRHHGEGDAAGKLLAQAMEIGEGEQQRRGAAFHVDGAAAMQAAVCDVARPGSRCQAARSPTGKTSRWPFSTRWRPGPLPPSKPAMMLGLSALGAFGAMGDAFLVQKGVEEVGGLARVARRVGGVDAGEAPQEVDLAVALAPRRPSSSASVVMRAPGWADQTGERRLVHDPAVLDHGQAGRAADGIGDAARIVGVRTPRGRRAADGRSGRRSPAGRAPVRRSP